jgi:hypothetical protein
MPQQTLPFLLRMAEQAATAGTISNYAFNLGAGIIGKYIDSSMTADQREWVYDANTRNRNVYPPPEAIYQAMCAGYIDPDDAKEALDKQGVQLYSRQPGRFGSVHDDFRSHVWAATANLQKVKPAPADIQQLMSTGRIKPILGEMMKNGYFADWQKLDIAIRASGNQPDTELLRQMFALGKITPVQYREGMRAIGWHDDTAVARVRDHSVFNSESTVLALWLRGLLDDNEVISHLTALGYRDDFTRQRIMELAKVIPPPSEIIRFAVREVWDQDTVERWGYDEEFPYQLGHWLKKQGYSWGETLINPVTHAPEFVDWPTAYWRAHWVIMSPSQAYQSYRRLRPERIHRYQESFPGVTPFELRDLNTVLKVGDYPPAMRKWLGAISSQPLRMYNIRRALIVGVRDRDWTKEQLLDNGYLPEDAETMIDVWLADEVRRANLWKDRLRQRSVTATYNEILAGYADGFVDRTTAFQRIQALEADAGQVLQELDLIDSRLLRQHLKDMLRALRRDYLSGSMSDPEILLQFRALNLTPASSGRYLARWQSLRSVERRTATTAQILAWVREGLMPATVANSRLLNLGWVQGDALIAVQDAVNHANQSEARASAAQGRQAASQAKQLEAAAKTAQTALTSAQSQLARLTPRSVIQAWYKKGIVSQSWVTTRLSAMGYPIDEIRRYLEQWGSESADAAAKAPAGQANQAGKANGQAGVPLTGGSQPGGASGPSAIP